MPIYEYRCTDCRRRFSVFWRAFSAVAEETVTCRHCGSRDVARLISRVRVIRSEESRLDDLDDLSTWGDFDENDPKSMGRMMRKMTQELGDEAGDLGPEFGEVLDRLESGQTPEQIESDLPALAGAGGDDGDLDF